MSDNVVISNTLKMCQMCGDWMPIGQLCCYRDHSVFIPSKDSETRMFPLTNPVRMEISTAKGTKMWEVIYP